MAKKVVLITGASSGIGAAITEKLVSQGSYIVIATARKESLKRFDNLSFTKSENCKIKPLNILNSDERETCINEIINEHSKIDILINNAGISFRSSIEDMSQEDEILQMSTNYISPMEIAKLCIPHMRSQKSGRIINISSVSGMMAMPTMGSYSASKFALEGASESLWYELKAWNIFVTLIQPGFIRSDSFKNVYRSSKSTQQSIYEPLYQAMGGFVEKLMRNAFATPEDISEAVLKAITSDSPPLRIIPSFDSKFFFFLRRLLPRRFYHWLLYRSLPRIREWEAHALHHS